MTIHKTLVGYKGTRHDTDFVKNGNVVIVKISQPGDFYRYL